MKITINDRVDKYKIVQHLGGGNFGEVYRANQIILNAERAVKFIQQQPGQKIVPLLEEVRNLHAAAEDHVVKVFSADIIPHDGENLVAIEMEYLPDGSLYDLAKNGTLSFREKLTAIRHTLYALAAAHNTGIIHHDIKPANIMKSGNNYKLGDFGLSYLKGGAIGPNNLAYVLHAAPELFNGTDPNELSDIYSVGMTLYRLFLPVSKIDLNMTILSQWRSKKLVKTFPDYNGFPTYIPLKLKNVIKKSTVIDPTDRYQSVEEMLLALDRLSVNIDWKIFNNGARCEATKDGKTHVAELKLIKGKAVCQYKINGRKPRSWTNEGQSGPAAVKKLQRLIKSTLLY